MPLQLADEVVRFKKQLHDKERTSMVRGKAAWQAGDLQQ
jgi:hypothetical protein